MGIFSKFRRREATATEVEPATNSLLEALMSDELVTKEVAMSIPAVAACVNKIANTVASLDVHLYKKIEDDIIEIEDDIRTYRLNGDTGDTLNGYQLKAALVRDMLLCKGGYAFVRRSLGSVAGIYYVPSENVSINRNTDVIFKNYQINVQGRSYEGYQFLKLLRASENGWSGKSIIADSNKLFQLVTASQDYEKAISKTGGAKRGFFKAQHTLDNKAMQTMRDSYRRLYVEGSEACMVLNDGMNFQEISADLRESQMNENKQTNNDDICKIFGIPPAIINGGATKEDRREFYEGCIYPTLSAFTKALNDTLLNPWVEGEKDMFFEFDDEALTRADIKERYEAYEIGIKNGFLQLDDVRERENLPKFNLGFVKLGLQDVLIYPEDGRIVTPNMGTAVDIDNIPEGGQIDDKSKDQG